MLKKVNITQVYSPFSQINKSVKWGYILLYTHFLLPLSLFPSMNNNGDLWFLSFKYNLSKPQIAENVLVFFITET